MATRRRFLRVTGIAVTTASTALAGCLDSTVEETQFVELREDEFDPKNVRAEEGMPFAWENTSEATHVIESASDNWEFEAEVDSGNVTNFTFERSDVYRAVCSVHGDPEEFTGMRMKIAVGDAEIEDPVQ